MRLLRSLLHQPRHVYQVLVPALVGAWLLSSIGGDKTRSEGGTYYVGATGWVLFCVLFVITAIYSIAQLVRLLRRSSPSAVAVSNPSKESS